MKDHYSTIEDIAKKTGKSIATVSRVLNGIDQKGIPISKKTRDDVLAAASELGYVPNFAARALSLRNSMAIGLIIPDIMQLFFNQLCYTVSIKAEEKQYSIFLSHSYEDTNAERKSLDMMASRRVNGIILAPAMGDKNIEYLETLQKKQIPVVLVDRYFKNNDNFYCVTSDDIDGSYRLVSHIIKKGAGRIAFIAGNKDTSVSIERIEGYRKALEENGIEADESLIISSSYFQEDGYSAMKYLIESGKIKTIDAVMGVNDYISMGILDALEENKISVPDSILVAGYGNNKYLKYFKKPVTTVDQKVEVIAEKAFEILIELTEGRIPQERHIKIPCTLIPR